MERLRKMVWKLILAWFCCLSCNVGGYILSHLEEQLIGNEGEGDNIAAIRPIARQELSSKEQNVRVHAVETASTNENGNTRPIPKFDTTKTMNLMNPSNYSCDFLPLEDGHNAWDDRSHKMERIHRDESHICGPKVLIIGAMKCGTNTVGHLLAKHPRVILNRCQHKKYLIRGKWTKNHDCNVDNFQGSSDEMGFWEGNDLRRHNISDTWMADWTQRLPWTDGINNISVDKSPSNLNTFKHPDVPQLAHKLLPNAKVVVTLCKPDTRIYSEFQYHMVPKRHQHLVDQFEPHGRVVPDNFVDFAEANLRCLEEANRNYDNAKEDVKYYCEILLNDYVRIGEYVRHLQPWYELYGEGNVLVVDMEQDAKSKVAALLSHIGEDLVPSEEYPWQELEDDGENNEEFFTNKSYEGRDSVFLKHPYIMQKLEDHYAPFNEALAAMIGADFPLNWNNRTS
ncbi:sulfotransferase family protein [Nitzschia inconspicua]|uniref:Sulfotransferase family protein n=1 Tax=Nitzschia inconspicua TaxID=303405 RepID=A0A9K3L1C7_9STRA|nr:sulfotransferase family protein [Nitzschia inconspicua]